MFGALTSYCEGWIQAAEQQVALQGGGNTVTMLGTQPGNFLSQVTVDLANIIRQSGLAEANTQLSCLATWFQVETNSPVSQWLSTWAPILEQAKVMAGVRTPLKLAAKTPMAFIPAPGAPPAPPPVTMSEPGQLVAGSPIAWWMWVAGGALVIGVGYVVAKKRGLL